GSRAPRWRRGGPSPPPRPRSYDFKLSKKVEIGALRSELAEKIKAGEVMVVDAIGGSGARARGRPCHRRRRARPERRQDQGGRRDAQGARRQRQGGPGGRRRRRQAVALGA